MMSSPKRSGTLSAQETVKLAQGKSGLVKMKKRKWHKFSTTWQYRFVVTSRDTMFIFDNERSKSAEQSIRLLGYKGVCRYESKDNDWCFRIVPGIVSPEVIPIEFLCLSEQDRKSWMEAIKQLLYKANGVEEKRDSLRHRLQRLDDNGRGYAIVADDEYAWLEEPVFEPLSVESSDRDLHHDDEGDSSDSDDADSGLSSRPISSDVSTAVLPPVFRHEANSHKHNKNRTNSMPLAPPPPPPCRPRGIVSEYVNIRPMPMVEEDDDYIYPPSLVDQCSMIHMNQTREELLGRLQGRTLGTYFIRKSRNDNRKVLAIHCGAFGPREVKIMESNDGFSIDNSRWFKSIEQLLKHYTLLEEVPVANILLKRGILVGQEEEEEEENEEQVEGYPYSDAG